MVRVLSRVALVLAAAIVVGGCVDDAATDDAAGTVAAQEVACHRTPVTTAAVGLPEVRGATTTGSIYGLLFTAPPIHAGQEVKIVWRVTDTRDIALVVTDPSGARHPLTFGPEPHGGSNWQRPGAEWGTGVVFDRPGCWHLRIERDTGSGDVWLPVVA